MADPLSITASIITLIQASIQVTVLINQFRNEASAVDATLTGLLNDVEGFKRVLESMKETVDQSDIKSNLQSTGHTGSHWKNLARSLKDGTNTLEKLHDLLDGISKKTSVLDTPRKLLRLKSALGQIAQYREQIQSSHTALQLSLSTIILWNQVTFQKSTESIPDQILPTLDKLYDEFRKFGALLNAKIEKLQHAAVDPADPDNHNLQYMSNLRECVRSAADVVSTASTSINTDTSDKISVKYGSDFGDVFVRDANEPMLRWFTSNTVYEYESVEAPLPAPSEASAGDALTEYNSDTDSDLENDLIRSLFKEGKKRKEQGDLTGAVRHFRNCLTRFSSNTSYASLTAAHSLTACGVSKLELLEHITDSYCLLGAWPKAKLTMAEKLVITERQVGKKDAIYLNDNMKLAEIMMMNKDYVEAHLQARRSLRGFRKLGENGQTSYENCLAFLIQMSQREGKEDEEEAYTALLVGRARGALQAVPEFQSAITLSLDAVRSQPPSAPDLETESIVETGVPKMSQEVPLQSHDTMQEALSQEDLHAPSSSLSPRIPMRTLKKSLLETLENKDDMPTRNPGRESKQDTPVLDALEIAAPNSSPAKPTPTMTRETKHSSSKISGNSVNAVSGCYAFYDPPLFTVFGLSPEFLKSLKKHHGKLPKERKPVVGSSDERLPTPESLKTRIPNASTLPSEPVMAKYQEGTKLIEHLEDDEHAPGDRTTELAILHPVMNSSTSIAVDNFGRVQDNKYYAPLSSFIDGNNYPFKVMDTIYTFANAAKADKAQLEKQEVMTNVDFFETYCRISGNIVCYSTSMAPSGFTCTVDINNQQWCTVSGYATESQAFEAAAAKACKEYMTMTDTVMVLNLLGRPGRDSDKEVYNPYMNENQKASTEGTSLQRAPGITMTQHGQDTVALNGFPDTVVSDPRFTERSHLRHYASDSGMVKGQEPGQGFLGKFLAKSYAALKNRRTHQRAAPSRDRPPLDDEYEYESNSHIHAWLNNAESIYGNNSVYSWSNSIPGWNKPLGADGASLHMAEYQPTNSANSSIGDWRTTPYAGASLRGVNYAPSVSANSFIYDWNKPSYPPPASLYGGFQYQNPYSSNIPPSEYEPAWGTPPEWDTRRDTYAATADVGFSASQRVSHCPICNEALSKVTYDALSHVNKCIDEQHATADVSQPAHDARIQSPGVPSSRPPSSSTTLTSTEGLWACDQCKPDTLQYLSEERCIFCSEPRNIEAPSSLNGFESDPSDYYKYQQTSQILLPRNGSKPIVRRKVVLLGDPLCGKTYLATTWNKGQNPSNLEDKVTDNFTKTAEVEGFQIELVIWDCKGADENQTTRLLSYVEAHMVLICFDISDPDSFANVEFMWKLEAERYCSSVPKILVGCKKDLRADTQTLRALRLRETLPISPYAGNNLAIRMNALAYFETSIKDGQSLSDLFNYVAKVLLGAAFPPRN